MAVKTKPETTDVIVIGGGAAGLAAARKLSRVGIRVIVLEARSRLGGRILTRRPSGWPIPIELGAEFIHAGNSRLWRLVRKARIKTQLLNHEHWLDEPRNLHRIEDLDGKIASVLGRIEPARAGRKSFAAYFSQYPAAVSSEAWVLARGFVEGFEAASPGRISARSLIGVTTEPDSQYRLPKGYDQVVDALAGECIRNGARLATGTVVRSVRWKRGSVEVRAHDSRSRGSKVFLAKAAVITLPLGVLKDTGPSAVAFAPPLTEKRRWIDRMEVGHVVRLVVRFKKTGWRQLVPAPLQGGPAGFGFVHASRDGEFVWWSLSGEPILVGWIGGPTARELLQIPMAARRQCAVRSLAALFEATPDEVSRAVADWRSWDWTNDPFSRGAYSYTAAGADEASDRLRRPLQRTLFFAGEATAPGTEVGTVHGALASGVRAAKEVMRAVEHGRERPSRSGGISYSAFANSIRG